MKGGRGKLQLTGAEVNDEALEECLSRGTALRFLTVSMKFFFASSDLSRNSEEGQ